MNLRIRIYIFQLPAENVVNFLRVLYSFKSSLSKFYIINNYYSAMNWLFNYGYYKKNHPMLIRLIINKKRGLPCSNLTNFFGGLEYGRLRSQKTPQSKGSRKEGATTKCQNKRGLSQKGRQGRYVRPRMHAAAAVRGGFWCELG